jgi:hypothetical protein
MMVSAQFKNLLDKHLNKVSEGVFEDMVKREAMIPTLFDVISGNSAWWEEMDVSGMPDVPRFTGQLEYLDMYPGYTTRIEPAEFAAGARFERKLIDDNQFNVMKNRAGMLGEAYFRTREKDAVKYFAQAFSNVFSYTTSEENLSLCNTAHTSKSGASTATGFGNSTTAPLTETSLEAARVTANRFRNDIGERIFVNFDTLLVPDSLSRIAYEITQTPKGLYTANGTINVQDGQPHRWNVIVYKLYDDYDTNNWFIIDSRQMKKFLKWIDRIKMITEMDTEFDSKALKYSVYGRWGYGHLNWRWIYGANVT